MGVNKRERSDFVVRRRIKQSLAVITAAVIVAGAAVLYPTGNVVHGVYVEGKDVSGYTPDELRKFIVATEADNADGTVQVSNGQNGTVSVKRKALGIETQVDKTVQEAMQYGYDASPITYVTQRLSALFHPVHMKIAYSLNEPAATEFLTKQGKAIGKPGHDAYLTVSGQNVTLHKEVTGRKLDIGATLKEWKQALADGEVSLDSTPLPLVIDEHAKPKVTGDALKGITTVLGSYQTTFNSGATSRTHNIAIASDKINGTLIKSGKQFSFNTVVGERTAEAGYDDAPVFVNGKLEPGIGGGICQVSSTLFNAALLSGMKIEERTPHFEPVGYIPAGRDATVAYGYLDFCFKNPYKQSIYVVSHMDGDTLTVYILGTAADAPKNASINVGDQKVIPHKKTESVDPTLKADSVTEGHDGMSLVTTRHLVWADGRTLNDTFDSTYDPVDTVIVKAAKAATGAAQPAQPAKPQ